MSIPINKKCTSLNRTFFGMCHAGVGEYIVPIESKIHGILGFFTVGSYRLDNSKSRELIEKICLDYSLDYNTATELYLSLREVNYDCTLIENAFDIAADYLSKIFDTSKSTNAVSKLSKPVSSEDITMTKILNVLEQNYLENLNVSVISNLCCCSESYISHIFKKKTGVTIKTYINWLRVEKAKHLLKTTDKTITEISNLIGFNNSTYFTKVFTSFEKISPREYKKVAVT